MTNEFVARAHASRGQWAPELAGRTAIVTGAGRLRSIGRPVALELARQGVNIVLTGTGRDPATYPPDEQEVGWRDIESVADEVRATGAKAVTLVSDVSDPAAVAEMVRLALAHFGRIDILVNNAGAARGPDRIPVVELPFAAWLKVINVNLLGTFLPCRAAIPQLIERGGGRIVNIAGTSGLRGYRNRVAYSSSKWAVRGLTRTLALELGPFGITVNDVCPNVTHGRRMDTIVNEKARVRGVTSREIYEEYEGQTALGRFIEESDVAAAVSFLVSEGARNITGHDIVVDAGWDV